MTNVETVFARKAQLEAQMAAIQAELDLLNLFVNSYNQISYNVVGFADRCRALGKTAVMASLPPEVATAIQSALDTTAAFWAANSPYPFPELPADPVPPEPVPEPDPITP